MILRLRTELSVHTSPGFAGASSQKRSFFKKPQISVHSQNANYSRETKSRHAVTRDG
jgi:hypothetical protein